MEKNTTNQTYQATYLYGTGLGNHDYTDWVFRCQGNKNYHSLIHSTNGRNVAGQTYSWSGGYTFFHTPLYDDANVLVYTGVINGRDAVFINTKQSCNVSINLPESMLMHSISVIEKSNTITADTHTDEEGITIEATGTGSLICTGRTLDEPDTQRAVDDDDPLGYLPLAPVLRR